MFSANDVIGPYTLIRELGRGGYKVVWLAEKRNSLLPTNVALGISLDPAPDIEMLRDETQRWLRATGHPNVLPFKEAEIYGRHVVIISEYAPGGSLATWLRKHNSRAPSVPQAVEMMCGILSGLEHLHNLKPDPIIHRDLKPANVLLNGDTPCLTDFGISRVLKTTAQTQASGTPAYMPPEAFDGRYSAQSDIWAAGVMLYEMIAGRLPFAQTEATALFGAIVKSEPPSLPPWTPSHVRGVVTRALNKNPALRYATAGDMREALSGAPGLAVVAVHDSPGTTARPAAAKQTTLRTRPEPDLGDDASTNDSKAPWMRKVFGGIPKVTGLSTGTGSVGRTTRLKTALGQFLSDMGVEAPAAAQTVRINAKDGAEMILIPAGECLVGDDDDAIKDINTGLRNNPRRTVKLSAFWIYRNLVTVGQYQRFCDETRRPMPDRPSFNPYWNKLAHPIINVTWEDAAAYAAWAGTELPTEMQWEKAARGTEARQYPWGDRYDWSRLASSKKTAGDADGTSAVGEYAVSPYGIADMAGNVCQWCKDWYDVGFTVTMQARGIDPVNETVGPKQFRALRGGSWFYFEPDYFRSSFRYCNDPARGFIDCGFRCIVPATSVSSAVVARR